MSSLRLDVLGSRIDVISSDPWISLMADLFAPFVTGDTTVEGRTLVVEERGGTYLVGFEDEDLMSTDDPWLVLLRARVLIGKWALDSVPEQKQGLHGGVVLSDAGAVVLAGAAGAGKSTLTAHLVMRKGWGFGGDDVYCLHLEDGSVGPLPMPPALKDLRTWATLSTGWERPSFLPEPSTAFLVPPRVLGSASTAPAPLAAVVVISRSDDREPSIEGLSVAETSIPFAGEGNHVGPRALSRIVAILGETDRFRVRYSEVEEVPVLLRGVGAGLE